MLDSFGEHYTKGCQQHMGLGRVTAGCAEADG